MKRKLAQEALNEISDAHIDEAAHYKKKRIIPWLSAVAAVLVLAIGISLFSAPLTIKAGAVSLAAEPRVSERPRWSDYDDEDQWRADEAQWRAQQEARDAASLEALSQMTPFLLESCRTFLTGTGENRLYSPLNAYIGLAMATELTGGETRQQLLDALGATDTDALRSQVSALWENAYTDDGNEICTLAGSLWLDEALTYRQAPMDALAYHYYTSVYRQTLTDAQTKKDIQAWLNNNTGGFLKSAVNNLEIPEEAVMLLYTTIYFRSRWNNEFSAGANTQRIFHGTAGDRTHTFMNKQSSPMFYYWGDSFSAVALGLENGSRMWFILPDEGKTTDDVLQDPQYLQMVMSSYDEWANKKAMLVNLSVPMFDVQTTASLREGLQSMGITHLFDMGLADFSPAFDGFAFITDAKQSVRVSIDEEGVTAAAYFELPAAGAAMPPEEIIDFILDRPFLFVITRDCIPLFAGVINQP